MIKECANLFSTGSFLQASSFISTLPLALTVSACWINFSVASLLSLFLFKITSSHNSLKVGSISSYTTNCPAFTIPISIPALMACNKNTEWMASLTWSLPLNEKDTFDTPPETFANGINRLISLVASIKSTA